VDDAPTITQPLTLRVAMKAVMAHQLRVNPDCGLNTRGVDEVTASLRILVAAAEQVRAGN
jgi:5-methyltetrahydropteroyltriglutamate--homocysteine methyltransferase